MHKQNVLNNTSFTLMQHTSVKLPLVLDTSPDFPHIFDAAFAKLLCPPVLHLEIWGLSETEVNDYKNFARRGKRIMAVCAIIGQLSLPSLRGW